ncbi:MAG: molybdenum cofactor guanylyltransferase [Gemmatimonadetes bacterium]|jgi:molybdopterin-guanine dinucleotide biosynthesis protein A|nr:molybdenum cofactor guanylyltransferase [Gemmatimonadota bacterium]MBT4612325.1 molybdenum cofactor guanylyltransferase [Gemmatimonadota bacterium]MBT5055568.1 molybdenum cofactor guanylyltransferase [Gemmatimonadota bacterium]MBT5143916.1 molybdenum cofactor guanylyltransferase [Gemmatimonadota bacterium]MBT5588645.1 molybdenum cofactor guanylyltransferase [Gemmatimonadota bacterium]
MQAGDPVSGPHCGIAILAGGNSRRLGQPKACLHVGGRPLLQRVLGATSSLDTPTWLVRAAEPVKPLAELMDDTGVPQLIDEYQDAGPLGGLATALAQTSCQRVLLLACDLPFLSSEFLRWLLDRSPHSTAVVPEDTDADHLHPLCAVYDRRCQPVLNQCLESGRFRVHDFLARLNDKHIVPSSKWQAFDTGGLLANINTEADLAQAQLIAGA